MSHTVSTKLRCDDQGCINTSMPVYDTAQHDKRAKSRLREARQKARTAGWTRVGGQDFCPVHKPGAFTL